jgi:hypothetical protein
VVGSKEGDADSANGTICGFVFSAAPLNGMDIKEYERDVPGNGSEMPRNGRDMPGKGRDMPGYANNMPGYASDVHGSLITDGSILQIAHVGKLDFVKTVKRTRSNMNACLCALFAKHPMSS